MVDSMSYKQINIGPGGGGEEEKWEIENYPLSMEKLWR